MYHHNPFTNKHAMLLWMWLPCLFTNFSRQPQTSTVATPSYSLWNVPRTKPNYYSYSRILLAISSAYFFFLWLSFSSQNIWNCFGLCYRVCINHEVGYGYVNGSFDSYPNRDFCEKWIGCILTVGIQYATSVAMLKAALYLYTCFRNADIQSEMTDLLASKFLSAVSENH